MQNVGTQVDNMSLENYPLTFFVWADMHFGYRQKFAEEDFRWRTVQQMNDFAGWPYPPEIGGCVEEPSLILVCGDFVTACSDGERDFAYYQNALRQTSLPSYEAMGNHEIGYANIIGYFKKRYGNLYYSFNHQGVHFVALCQTFDARERVEALDDEQLKWLENDLASLDKQIPVVVFAHDDLDKQPNAGAIHAVLQKANVILTLSGHTHGKHNRFGCSHDWNGIPVLNTGHVRDHPTDMIYGRFILVVRIAAERTVIVPWRWDLQEWASHQGERVLSGSEHVVLKR